MIDDSPDVAKFTRSVPLRDPAATAKLGQILGAHLRRGDLIFLRGDLGAGKTSLARGLITALTGEINIPSPTYNLVQTYKAPAFDIWHLDLYRLQSPDEIFELGLDEALGSAACLVEWPERMETAGPKPDLVVSLEPDGNGGRVARLKAGPAWEERLAAI